MKKELNKLRRERENEDETDDRTTARGSRANLQDEEDDAMVPTKMKAKKTKAP